MASVLREDPLFNDEAATFNHLMNPAGQLTDDLLGELREDEKRVVHNFVYLWEKSSQLFLQLRYTNLNGVDYNWQFSRTFDTFSKLWNFQQEHRKLLAERYGLKRWQIGEIASKIGQLYYHYYLRTSDTSYLHEALIFYLAIRQRDYYNTTDCSSSSTHPPADRGVLVKKLRFYARFLIVAITLNRLDLVLELKSELSELVILLPESHTPHHVNEWKGIVNEVTRFRSALCALSVTKSDTTTVTIPKRTSPTQVVSPELTLSPNPVKLDHALIVGHIPGQPKVTELSIDMFLMGMMLEKCHKSTGSHIQNCNKQYLYKPTPVQVLEKLAEMNNGSHQQSLQLIYLSGTNVTYTDKERADNFSSEGGIHFSCNETVGLKFSR